jgi:hypothetical protein
MKNDGSIVLGIVLYLALTGETHADECDGINRRMYNQNALSIRATASSYILGYSIHKQHFGRDTETRCQFVCNVKFR